MTINFDNAATTFPKPVSVANAIFKAVKQYGETQAGEVIRLPY